MRHITVLALVLMMFIFRNSPAQIVTLQLKPDAAAGNDAFLASSGASANYGNHPEFAGQGWTCGATNCTSRGLISFDLSSIPSSAIVINAVLNLYANSAPVNGNGLAMQGANAARIYKVTSPWTESSVTWANQPTYTTVNSVNLLTSTFSNQNYLNVDVTNMVADMTLNPINNHGFLLKLLNEVPYNTMTFASSDFSDSLLWPELIINYTLDSSIIKDTCIVLTTSGSNGADAFLASFAASVNYGSHPELSGLSWTCSGSPCKARGLLNFDFSVIPSNAYVYSALLDLFANPNPGNGNGVAMQGNNASVIQRVITPWIENTVTWNSQPLTTTVNQASLLQSTSASQNYLNVDIKNLILDILNSGVPSNGFLLKLVNESGYTSMTFASSDYAQGILQPTLQVCYRQVLTGLNNTFVSSFPEVIVYPNPSTIQDIQVKFIRSTANFVRITLNDLEGRLISTWSYNLSHNSEQNLTLPLPEFKPENGLYLLHFQFDNESSITKRIVLTE